MVHSSNSYESNKYINRTKQDPLFCCHQVGMATQKGEGRGGEGVLVVFRGRNLGHGTA